MSYEIPKNLKYEEKIIFNLSLGQSFWISLFAILGVIIFFKTPLIFELKIALIIILGLLGLGFAFLNFQEYSKNLLNFILHPRELGYLDKKMNGFLEAKRIYNDCVYLKNGSVKAIVHIQPINFHILSKKQQGAIISAYKDFLNSLDFPIQIVMRTVNLSIDEYLQKLEFKVMQKKNEKLLSQFNEFKDFMLSYIEENTIKNRLFYIIIPSEQGKPFQKNDLAEQQLNIRTKLCQEKLHNCNLITKRLNTNELTSLLSTYFEGFIEVNNDYQSYLTILKRSEEK